MAKWLPTWTGFSGKTLWDWLQLLSMLAIPILIFAASLIFTHQQDLANAIQHVIDQKTALDQQQEMTLKTYLDDMSDLLLNHNLRESKPGDGIRVLAQAKTLTALKGLGADRKRILLLFLYQTQLIAVVNRHDIADQGSAIVSLSSADLTNANLSEVDLNGAFLYEANLSGAKLNHAHLYSTSLYHTNLSGADLSGADLSGAYMQGANLQNADLTGAFLKGAEVTQAQLMQAKSLKGAILPDGSLSP
jgi:Pentapeptide repeats (8 copies)